MLLAFCFLFSSSTMGSALMYETPADSLDSTIRHHAFKALVHRRTGVAYDVPLPPNLTGVRAAVVRLSGRTLWLAGVSIGSFRIPPRTVSVPAVGRLVIVYQDLGNRSSSYYQVQNYSLATPVLGLLAYDAKANASSGTVDKLDIKARGAPIVVSFTKAYLPGGTSNSTEARCMTFGSTGSQRMDNMTGMDQCSTGRGGHFSIIVPKYDVFSPVPPAPSPSVPSPPAPPPAMTKRKRRRWVVLVVALGGTVVGLMVLCLVGAAVAVFMKRKKVEEMRRQAEDGEVLETVYVNGSKMPSATMSRTLPVLESESAP